MKTKLGGASIAIFSTCFFWLVLTSTGCGDPATAIQTSPTPSLSVTYTSTGTDSTWNYVAMDVVLSMEGDYAGFNQPDAYRAVSLHTERILGSDSVWRTVNTFDALEPMGPIPQNGSHYPIGRTETDEDWSYFSTYNTQGDLIPEEDSVPELPISGITGYRPDTLSPLPGFPEHPDSPPPPDDCLDGCVPIPSEQRASLRMAGVRRGNSREWLDATVVTPGARARNAARIQRRHGKSTSHVRGLDRYARKRGNLVLEVLFDPAVSAVAEENVWVNGVQMAHTVHTYVKVRPDVFVRSLSRTEVYAGPRSAKPLVFESRTTNVRIEQRSAQP